MTTKLERFTLMARDEPQTRFNALMGLLTDPDGLLDELRASNGTKAPGVDGVRKDDYAEGVAQRLDDLSAQFRRQTAALAVAQAAVWRGLRLTLGEAAKLTTYRHEV